MFEIPDEIDWTSRRFNNFSTSEIRELKHLNNCHMYLCQSILDVIQYTPPGTRRDNLLRRMDDEADIVYQAFWNVEDRDMRSLRRTLDYIEAIWNDRYETCRQATLDARSPYLRALPPSAPGRQFDITVWTEGFMAIFAGTN